MKLTIRCLIFIFAIFLCVMPAFGETAMSGDVVTPLKNIVLADCESADGWESGGEISLEKEDIMQGENALRIVHTLPSHLLANHYISWTMSAPLDLTDMKVLEFDFYISDLQLLNAASVSTVSISSSGGPNEDTLNWNLSAVAESFQVGWNHVTLPFSAASMNGFDEKNLNYFRILFSRVSLTEDLEDIVLMIDNITARSVPTRTVMVDDCDTVAGWGGNPSHNPIPTSDTTNFKQGTASNRYFITTQSGGHLVSHKQYAPINATGLMYVEMDIYVSDLKPMAHPYSNYGMHFEIASSGQCDVQEYEWDLVSYLTKTGWNHVRLPVSADIKITGGSPNMAAINYLRFHMLSMNTVDDGGLTFKVDNITFVVPTEEVPTKIVITPIVKQEEPEPPAEEVDPPAVVDPNTPVEDDQNQSELRVAQTAQRAKIVLIMMAFAIIGIDIVAVVLRRRNVQSEMAEPESEDS